MLEIMLLWLLRAILRLIAPRLLLARGSAPATHALVFLHQTRINQQLPTPVMAKASMLKDMPRNAAVLAQNAGRTSAKQRVSLALKVLCFSCTACRLDHYDPQTSSKDAKSR